MLSMPRLAHPARHRTQKLLGRVELAACSDTSKASSERVFIRLSVVRFANGRKRSMGHFLGAEKEFFLIRGRGRPRSMAAAPV